ncbi:PREDICTED: uncharacterized protein LOC109581476 [Amphimedon queenslandica]|uniref:Uncharacterized protein n=1 Tax=Amphimedon queenslandica TaxID=400682 RepID=A0A1X7VV33_AMPQE|nr:PREDICTED: uncharacterized protein LOC109581476 [Amphimedon queenslandica]|eukprot:XP_019851159.1 PREDICTED: uncharacterized protein LOC109581476 [Amphimedon queenslandica]
MAVLETNERVPGTEHLTFASNLGNSVIAALETDKRVFGTEHLVFSSNLGNNVIDGEVALKIGQNFLQLNAVVRANRMEYAVVTANRMEYLAHCFKRGIQQSIRTLQHFLPDWQPNPRNRYLAPFLAAPII